MYVDLISIESGGKHSCFIQCCVFYHRHILYCGLFQKQFFAKRLRLKQYTYVSHGKAEILTQRSGRYYVEIVDYTLLSISY